MDAPAATVLIVEDEPFVRFVASDILSDSGFSTLEAGTAVEALELLASHREVAVLFTDINMPGEMDGLALAAHVAEKRPEVKIVVTSGRQWLPDWQLPDHGRFVPKPYRADELARVVREQVERRAFR